jgi:hypothetical protein
LTAELVAGDSTSLWPTEEDVDWIKSQKARVWTRDGKRSLKNDVGRMPLHVKDLQPEECATMDKSLCTTDLEGMRLECPKTCQLYLEDDVYYAKYFPNSIHVSPKKTCQEDDAGHPTCPQSAATA